MSWFVKRKNGVVVFKHREIQIGEAEEELVDNHPDIIAFDTRYPAPDMSNVDNQIKAVKVLALMIGQVGGLTVPQTKALFLQKWNAVSGS